MPRYDRWPTRKERDRQRDEIEAADGVGAWLRAGRPTLEEARARQRRLNALAIKCGMAPPYPEADDVAQSQE